MGCEFWGNINKQELHDFCSTACHDSNEYEEVQDSGKNRGREPSGGGDSDSASQKRGGTLMDREKERKKQRDLEKGQQKAVRVVACQQVCMYVSDRWRGELTDGKTEDGKSVF